MIKPSISVIISTYNSEEWLEKVLIGYSVQTTNNFEVIIADDGSRPSTKILIDQYTANFPVPIMHLWHEDLGYRRQEILNVAIVKANHEYILMTDGDCIPRKDFVEVHSKLAQKGKFLSGGYCKLSMKVSKLITKEDIEQLKFSGDKDTLKNREDDKKEFAKKMKKTYDNNTKIFKMWDDGKDSYKNKNNMKTNIKRPYFEKIFEISKDTILDEMEEFVEGCKRDPKDIWKRPMYTRRNPNKIQNDNVQQLGSTFDPRSVYDSS